MATFTKVLAADVLNQANKLERPLTDADIETDCPIDGPVRLSDCRVEQASETTYVHAKCGSKLLVIGPYDDLKIPGSGYRLGDFTLRNPADVRIRYPGFTTVVVLPASPNAFPSGVADKPA